MKKIITKEEYLTIKKSLKNNQKKVVLCHGVFDLIHPGHIIHFQEAKNLGDILIVSVTAAPYVRKGPDRPYFDDEMRMKFLAAIEYVDYVMLSEGYTVDDIIEVVEPDLYVKGEEYQQHEKDITGKISEEEAIVEAHGGKVAYTKGQVFSSTKLINNLLPALSPEIKEFMVEFCENYSFQQIQNYVKKMENLKILIVGDVIIDEYIYCYVQGLMSKDRGYSARYENKEQYLGGSLAAARHISAFSSQVTLMSIVGNEEVLHSRILNELSDKMRMDLTYSTEFETIVKSRYVTVDEKREEMSKIFAINNLPSPISIDEASMQKFKNKLREQIQNYDAVFLFDFGHGLIDKDIIEILENKAKYLAVNCQTNSSNYGKNLITKYTRADAFALDEKELSLAFTDYHAKEKESLVRLAKHLKSSGWLTQGSRGATAVNGETLMPCPAFTLKVRDTIGAGDAFFSLAALTTLVGAPIEVGTFMGNIAGALAANIIGNKTGLEKINVLKYANTLLNI